MFLYQFRCWIQLFVNPVSNANNFSTLIIYRRLNNPLVRGKIKIKFKNYKKTKYVFRITKNTAY